MTERLLGESGRTPDEKTAELIDVLWTLTSFQTFDALSGDKRSAVEVTAIVQDLVEAALARYKL
jgi:hypothetical protein